MEQTAPFEERNIKFLLHGGWIVAQLNEEQGIRARKLQLGHFHTGWKCWAFPSSPLNAWRVTEEFKDDTKEVSAEVKALCDAYAEKQHTKSATDLPDIPGTKLSAWNHQRQAYHFGYGLHGLLLAMGMGTGKTLTTIGLLQNRKHDRTLIICPKSVIAVWPKEFQKHSVKEFNILALDGKDGSRKAIETESFIKYNDAVKKPYVVIVNYESAWREALAKILLKVEWDHFIADECHRIKSPSGKASRFCEKISKRAYYRIGLTGTPMPHSPLDIYAQGRAIDSTIFGTNYNVFKNRYALFGGFNNRQILKFINQDELHIKFEQFAYRVTNEVLDLPPFTHTHKSCSLEPAAQKAYDQMEDMLYCAIEDGEVTASNALVKILRLQQIASGYIKNDEGEVSQVSTAKQELLKEVLEDIDKDEPLVIFAVFRTDIKAIQDALTEAGRTFSELSGSKNELKEWQDGKTNSIVVQMRSGGVGIDLTRSAIQLYYSVGHSLGDYEQSIARTHRPGQTRAVRFIHLVVNKTIDETIYDALDKKRESITYVLETLKQKYRGDNGKAI